MAPFSDPIMDQLMDRYFDSDCQPQFLYQGSQENIVKELKAWLVRRKAVYKEQMELRDQSQKSGKEIMSGQVQKSEYPAFLTASLNASKRATVRKTPINLQKNALNLRI